MKKKDIDFSKQIQMAFKFMYIGRNYDGLVIQSSTHNTIEEVLFNAMKRCSLLEDKPIEQLMTEQNFSRCGRTDKGVNSTGNVFSLSLRYNEKYNYTKLINNLLPDDIVDSDNYEEYKEYCQYYYGSVKANRDDLVFYTKLVRDFDKLCDELRDYCDELSQLKFEVIEMEKAVYEFNERYSDDLELLGFKPLHCA